MRAILIGAALACLATPAFAQGMSLGKGRGTQGPTAQTTESPKPKVDEGAYRAAVDKIPDQKTASDPWARVRPATSKAK